jgi:hypothetical protein
MARFEQIQVFPFFSGARLLEAEDGLTSMHQFMNESKVNYEK